MREGQKEEGQREEGVRGGACPQLQQGLTWEAEESPMVEDQKEEGVALKLRRLILDYQAHFFGTYWPGQ